MIDSQRVLEKETQLHLAIRELDDYRARFRATESTRAQAHRELDKANRTLQELTNKLEIVSESKQTAIEATESAKLKSAQLEEHKSNKQHSIAGDAWKSDVDSEREQYKASAAELISAKQEHTTLRQDFDVALEAKVSAFQQAADAQHIAQVNRDKVAQLSREITHLRDALSHIKLASLQAQQEQQKRNSETLSRLQSLKNAKEQVQKNITSLKQESGPELDEDLEEKLEETTEAIKVLQEQLNNVRESDRASWVQATSELHEARKTMQEILEEQKSLQSFVDGIQLELHNVKEEYSELKNKACEAESAADNLQADLERNKTELQAALAGRINPQDARDMQMKIQQLASEAENDRLLAENIKNEVASLKQETELAFVAAKDAQERLLNALNELEEAKAAERRAGDVIHNSTKSDVAQASNSESIGKIKLSLADFESLSKKVEESRADADVKVATVMAQIETIKASENEALKNLERSEKEREELEAAIEDALKQAEMAEAAKQVVEGELGKWREKEQDEVGESSQFYQDAE